MVGGELGELQVVTCEPTVERAHDGTCTVPARCPQETSRRRRKLEISRHRGSTAKMYRLDRWHRYRRTW